MLSLALTFYVYIPRDLLKNYLIIEIHGQEPGLRFSNYMRSE